MPRKKRPSTIGQIPRASEGAQDAAPATESKSKTKVGKTAHGGAAANRIIPQSRRKRGFTEGDFKGLKYFALVYDLLKRLHKCATERDKAGNRILHYDQYCSLVLLFYFNPIIRSLRGIQDASELKKIQKKLGCARASLGSLSEAAHVFDSELLRQMIPELAAKILPTARGKDASALTPKLSDTHVPRSFQTPKLSDTHVLRSFQTPMFPVRPRGSSQRRAGDLFPWGT